MKNTLSIAERNTIVEEHFWCIDSVIRRNYVLLKSARMEYDDVYQQLAVRLIQAVAGFDPERGNLKQHIFSQLRYELLDCKSARRLHGFTGAPRDLRCGVISIDALQESDHRCRELSAA